MLSAAACLLLLRGALAGAREAAGGGCPVQDSNDTTALLQHSRQWTSAEAETGIVRIDFSRKPRSRPPVPTWRNGADRESRADCTDLMRLVKKDNQMKEVYFLLNFLCTSDHRSALLRMENGCLYLPADESMQKFYESVEHPNTWHFCDMFEDSFFPVGKGPCPTEVRPGSRARGAEGTEVTTCRSRGGREGFVSVGGGCLTAVPLGRTPASSNIRVYKLRGMLGLDLSWEQLLVEQGVADPVRGVQRRQHPRGALELPQAGPPSEAQRPKKQKGGAGKKPAAKKTGKKGNAGKGTSTMQAHGESNGISADRHHSAKPVHMVTRSISNSSDNGDDYYYYYYYYYWYYYDVNETGNETGNETYNWTYVNGTWWYGDPNDNTIKGGKGGSKKGGKVGKVGKAGKKGATAPSPPPPPPPPSTTPAPAPQYAHINVRYIVCDPGTGYVDGNATDAALAAQTAVLNRAYSGQDQCAGFLSYQPPAVDTHMRFVQEPTVRITSELCAMDCAMTPSILKMTESFASREDGVVKVIICETQLLGRASFPHYDDSVRVCVINPGCIPGSYIPNYNQGETLTHELGHYLGLYHTFQNSCEHPGDRVADTNTEMQPNYGCPGYRINTCGGGGLDPVHNFMDYSDDRCMCHFTPGQVEEMWRSVSLDQADLLTNFSTR